MDGLLDLIPPVEREERKGQEGGGGTGGGAAEEVEGEEAKLEVGKVVLVLFVV